MLLKNKVFFNIRNPKGRITYFFIYFKIIYYFFASSTWYKVFHIKTNVAIKALVELNHKTEKTWVEG